MILTILKIIGMILLVILAIILFVLLEILFFPIRYEAKGSYQEKANADVKITWFPVFLKVIASFHEGKFIYIIKAFGGIIMTNTDARLSYIGRKLFSEEDDAKASAGDNQDMPGSENEGNKQIPSNESKEKDYKETSLSESFREPDSPTEKKLSKEYNKKRKSLTMIIKQKIEDFIGKLKRFVENLKKIKEKKDALLKIYHSKRFEKAKKDVILYIRKLFRIIKPGKLEGNVHFGLNDPASTGEIFGVLAMFLPLYDGHFQLVPEFEYACVEGDLYMKGKIRIFPILMLGIQIIFNKNLIKVAKKVQTIIER